MSWTRNKLHCNTSIHFFSTYVYYTYKLLNISAVGSQIKKGYTDLCSSCLWVAQSTADWLHQDFINFSFGSHGFILFFCCCKTKLGEKERNQMLFSVQSIWNNLKTVLQPSRVVFWKCKDVNILHNQLIACSVSNGIWRCKALCSRTEGRRVQNGDNLMHAAYLGWVSYTSYTIQERKVFVSSKLTFAGNAPYWMHLGTMALT